MITTHHFVCNKGKAVYEQRFTEIREQNYGGGGAYDLFYNSKATDSGQLFAKQLTSNKEAKVKQ